MDAIPDTASSNGERETARILNRSESSAIPTELRLFNLVTSLSLKEFYL